MGHVPGCQLGDEGEDGCEHHLLPSTIPGFVPWGPCPRGEESSEAPWLMLAYPPHPETGSPKCWAVSGCSWVPPCVSSLPLVIATAGCSPASPGGNLTVVLSPAPDKSRENLAALGVLWGHQTLPR